MDLENFCHDKSLTEINNAVDDGPLFKLHRFDLSLYLLQSLMYNKQTTNRQVVHYVLITDISWSVKQFAINRRSLPDNILSGQSDVVDFA